MGLIYTVETATFTANENGETDGVALTIFLPNEENDDYLFMPVYNLSRVINFSHKNTILIIVRKKINNEGWNFDETPDTVPLDIKFSKLHQYLKGRDYNAEKEEAFIIVYHDDAPTVLDIEYIYENLKEIITETVRNGGRHSATLPDDHLPKDFTAKPRRVGMSVISRNA